MNEKQSPANKLLLFIYPVMEFLLLVLIGMFGYYFYQYGPRTRLIAIVPFSLYVGYRFVSRSWILWKFMSSEAVKEEQPDDQQVEDPSGTQ